MGTRADFYVGRTDQAEWLGSIAFDGYPSGVDHNDHAVLRATTEDGYRVAVSAMLKDRSDATLPERGWPWPWNDSGTTDYAYAFDAGAVYASSFGRSWYAPDMADLDDYPPEVGPRPTFPDMTARKDVAYDQRSGAIFLSAPRGE